MRSPPNARLTADSPQYLEGQRWHTEEEKDAKGYRELALRTTREDPKCRAWEARHGRFQ